jgi:hypothetical protein
MKMILRLNPFMRCIVGHAVVPYSDLADHYPGVRFITVLRDPIKRYVSQFQYLTRERDHKFSFQEFLDDSHYDNFQTRKIVESGDVEEARKVLAEKFLLVGIVEEFDEFLLMLRKRLTATRFDPGYQLQNMARDKKLSTDILERYHDEIIERNRSDLLLYEFVKKEVIPENRCWYGNTLDSDIAHFREQQTLSSIMRMKSGIDYVARKVYMEPITGIMRRFGGLPAQGSY